MTTSRLLAISAIVAASGVVIFAGGFAFALGLVRLTSHHRHHVSSEAVAVRAAPSISNHIEPPAARVPAFKMNTHVLLVSRSLLDTVPINYTLKVPMHHVRPDTPETLANASLIDKGTVSELLRIANSGPGNGDFNPEPDVYPEGEDEFDCLSDIFRGSKPLPPDLISSVINGLSLGYNLKRSVDNTQVIFSPITMMRADYPASEIPNTPAHEAPYANRVTIAVPDGGTLLLDAGPVKATRTETTPTRHLVVLLQPQILKTNGPELAKAN